MRKPDTGLPDEAGTRDRRKHSATFIPVQNHGLVFLHILQYPVQTQGPASQYELSNIMK